MWFSIGCKDWAGSIDRSKLYNRNGLCFSAAAFRGIAQCLRLSACGCKTTHYSRFISLQETLPKHFVYFTITQNFVEKLYFHYFTTSEICYTLFLDKPAFIIRIFWNRIVEILLFFVVSVLQIYASAHLYIHTYIHTWTRVRFGCKPVIVSCNTCVHA